MIREIIAFGGVKTMLMTYKAVLRGNQLEWRDTVPQPLAGGQKQVDVYVTILDEQVLNTSDKATQGKKMTAALEELATLPVRVSDPLEWEREQRQERELPQRR